MNISKKKVDNFILTYDEYFNNNIILTSLKNNILKDACKKYKLKVGGKKSILAERLTEYFQKIKHVLRIQSIIRMKIAKNYTLYRGPAIKNRELCNNNTDFVSLEPINEIPFEYFFSSTKIAKNISKAPISNARAQVANQTAALSKAIASTQWTTASARATATLRTAMLKGSWGSARKMRCVEILMSVLFSPTKADPQSAITFRTLQHTRRQLNKDPRRVHQFTQSLLTAHPPYNNIVGPAHGFANAIV